VWSSYIDGSIHFLVWGLNEMTASFKMTALLGCFEFTVLLVSDSVSFYNRSYVHIHTSTRFYGLQCYRPIDRGRELLGEML